MVSNTEIKYTVGECILAEINELEKYIDGLPKDLQDGYYGKAYRSRLQLLYHAIKVYDESKCYIAE